MEHIIKQIHKLLLKNEKTIAVAESCTGGLISYLLTSCSGSSKYFMLGAVVYSNKAKEDMLDIPINAIAKKGAVSMVTAALMAKSVRRIANVDLGVGVTGIAGPGSGSKNKPVGTVFIAIDAKNNKVCKKFNFAGSRFSIRKKAAIKSLELLRAYIARQRNFGLTKSGLKNRG